MISKDKTYRTRDGREVRIYATDGSGSRPIHGAVNRNNRWVAHTWESNGNYGCYEIDDDLIEVKPRIKRTVWLNVYEHDVFAYDTKPEADNNVVSFDRLACVKVEIDCEEGEGL